MASKPWRWSNNLAQGHKEAEFDRESRETKHFILAEAMSEQSGGKAFKLFLCWQNV